MRVVLPASGCEMIANVRRREISEDNELLAINNQHQQES